MAPISPSFQDCWLLVQVKVLRKPFIHSRLVWYLAFNDWDRQKSQTIREGRERRVGMEIQHVFFKCTQKTNTYLPVLLRFSNHRVGEYQYMEDASPLL